MQVSEFKISWSTFHANFTVEEVKKFVPSDPGVYTLWTQQRDKKWKCFYSGKATNIEARLLDHLLNETDSFYRRTKTSSYVWGFSWAEVFNENSQVSILKFLYDHYKPGWNAVDPGGFPTEVTLPMVR